MIRIRLASAMHLSEQYLTASQFFAHALRQAIGFPQCWQGFSGSSDFFRWGTGVLSRLSGQGCKLEVAGI
jgi:hypothetical protein